jgi:hypothetical protein
MRFSLMRLSCYLVAQVVQLARPYIAMAVTRSCRSGRMKREGALHSHPERLCAREGLPRSLALPADAEAWNTWMRSRLPSTFELYPQGVAGLKRGCPHGVARASNSSIAPM